MSLNHSRWNLLPPAPVEYQAETGFSRLIAQLLYNRGLRERSQIELFLASDERLSSDPFKIPGISQAVPRIYRALLSGEKIAVYGDFDVDGITGTALLVQGLTDLGAEVVPYIPHRVTEGHGLRAAALEELCRQGVSLVVTVDCGITDIAEVAQATRLGMDIVITDHHTPPAMLPEADAVVDPKLSLPESELSGVGVGFKLMEALFHSTGRLARLSDIIDLVAIGTIADMMPMRGENRYLVKQGLKQINSKPRLGISEMITQCGLSAGSLDEEKVTWCFAPWLNASGRLEHAMSSYKLLTTDSPQEAHELALLLGQKNTERQKLQKRFYTEAKEQVLARGLTSLLMICSTEYPIGVAGPVASKLSEEFYRPVVIVRMDDKTSSGSCRSIPEFNIIAALNRCSDQMNRFGGHAQAAGFTLPTDNLPQLQECLLSLADEQLKGVDLRPRVDIDTEVSLPELGGDTYRMIQSLAPFGKGNPTPTFLSRGVQMMDCRTMGNGADHLRLKLKQSGTVWSGVAFGLGDCFKEVSPALDIVYNLETDLWCGVESLRLNIVGFAPSNKLQKC